MMGGLIQDGHGLFTLRAGNAGAMIQYGDIKTVINSQLRGIAESAWAAAWAAADKVYERASSPWFCVRS